MALDAAASFAIERLSLPVTQPVGAGMPAGGDFFCPGALLEVAVDPASPLGHGLPPRTPVWFESSPAFDAPEGMVVARYGANPLLSGWLLGAAKLDRQAALVNVTLGRGHVVLFGFRPQYRAQSWATYIPFLNALYLSAATEGR